MLTEPLTEPEGGRQGLSVIIPTPFVSLEERWNHVFWYLSFRKVSIAFETENE